MAKRKNDITSREGSVSDTTLNNRYPQATEDLTDDGLQKDSAAAKELDKQRDFLAMDAKPFFQAAKDARRRYDQEWLGRNLFWRGFQFSRYMPQTQTVVLSSRQSSRVPINLVASNMRAIRNQVTSFRPKWEVLPTVPDSKSSQNQARYAQRLLDYYFDKLKLKTKIKETVTQGLLYSVGGPWQVIYNPLTKEVDIWMLDPFDYFVDPLAENHNDAEGVIKAARRPMTEVTRNPEYSLFARKEISSGDPTLAASEYKQFMIQAIKSVSPRIVDSSPMLILKEGYFRRRKETGEVYMVHCIWTDQNITPLLYEELDTDEFDFVVYRADLNPKEIYGESWIKHVMPINRALNILESSAFDYNYKVAKGRIVVDRDAGVRAIHNVHGEIIEKNRGATVESLDMAPLPVAVAQQIERMWRYMEDISGIHEASLGRIPTGVKTGVGIAELKQADATSQDDLVDNLEDFLTEVAIKLLKKIAQHYDEPKIVKDLGAREGQADYFAVVGKKFNKPKKEPIPGHEKQVKIGADWFDIAEIGDDNNIRVTIGSWLGYTKEALQQKVLQYFQLQLIDQKTALKLLEFGDIDSIVQQTRMESILKRPPVPGPNGEPGVDQMELANAENDMLLEGKPVPPNETDDHLVHIAMHQEALGQGMDHEVGTHIAKHQILAGKPQIVPSPNGMSAQDMQPAQQGQGPMAQASPVTNPVQPNNIIPPGTPPGQQLPQQNVQQSMPSNQQ